MRSAILGFAAGVCWLQTRAELPGAALSWLLLALACMLASAAVWLSRRRQPPPALSLSLRAACGALLGVLWASLYAGHYLAAELPLELEGRDLLVTGVVDDLPYRFEQGVRFRLRVEALALDGVEVAAPLPPRVALSWYARSADAAVPPIMAGERWQLAVRLKRPHGLANPHGFDVEAWLLGQQVRATGSVQTSRALAPSNQRLERFVPSVNSILARSRDWVRERIQEALQGRPYAGVVVALVIGEQREISAGDWKIFNRTGVGHLMSISGLHITMVASLFALSARALWRRSFFTRAQLPLRLPAQKLAALAGAGSALAYVALAGFGVPAQRTLYMLTVVALALWLGRITQVSHILCLALLAVLLADPWAVLWPGFWLSFAAVALILYVGVGRGRDLGGNSGAGSRAGGWRAGLATAARTQYAVTLGLAPLTVLLFGQVSLVGPVANAVAIPLVSFLVTPLALAGAALPAPLSTAAWLAAHQLLAWLAQFLAWCSQWPGAVWAAPIPPWYIFLAALAGACWLLAPRGWPLRWLGLLAWLPLLMLAPSAPARGVSATVFDVGQGSAVLLETAGFRMLYDSGPAFGPESDAAKRVILPYLRARGITHLDLLLVSHADNDHSGGARSLLEEIRLGALMSSLPLDHPLVAQMEAQGRAHQRCHGGAGGQTWRRDGVAFEILHPHPSGYATGERNTNARSCTLKVEYKGLSLLLPGDIEAAQEAALLARSRERLAATVLLAPHHGSATSSSTPFLTAVRPRLVIFQVGYRNRYRHPQVGVWERYRHFGIERLRSDRDGAITVHLGAELEVWAYRERHARYWFGR